MEVTNTVSIIIPVYNEEKYIRECLDSILAQSYDGITEILIIDGMSEDGTADIVKEYSNKCNKIIFLENKERIQSAALNLGIKKAKGEIIIRADAHAIYDKEYVLKSVSTLNEKKEEKVVNVGGPTYLLTSQKYIENAIVFLHESKFGIGVAKFRQKDYEGFVDTAWNGAFWKWIFDEVGFYNTQLFRSEDNDMNQRIHEKGYKIYQNKEIIAYYKPRSTIYKVLGQNLANGVAIGGSIVKNREIIRIRHLVPVSFFIALLTLGMASLFFMFPRCLLVLVLGSYFGIDSIASFSIATKKGVRYFPIMFLMFFLLHIAYGAGTIKGFLQECKVVNKK